MSAHTVARSVTVLGGGLAGLTVARELRAGGYGGAVRIVDPEGVPYDRPPLSKAYLEGGVTVEKLHLVPEAWYTEYGVELIAAQAVRLDPGTGSVRLADGRDMVTDAVVLATGGTPRRLPVPGGDLPGVHTLRTRADADRLRDVLRPGTRIAIVGAGLIGAEVASTAVGRGAEVTLIDTVDPPLAAAVGPEMARVLHAMHPAAGIRVLTGALTAITLRQGAYVLRVDGEEVLADAVLSAVGIRAGTELARGAGLATDNGVLVDPQQRTGNPSVYAAGDCARRVLPHGGPGPRTEHWEAALHQGQSVAAAILGQPAPAPQVPWFWSERHGSRLECVGAMNAEGRTVVRERDGQPPVFFRLGPDSTLLGCAALDSPRLVRAARRMIQSQRPTAAEALTDPAVDLRGLPR